MQHRHESGFVSRHVCEPPHAHLMPVHFAGYTLARLLYNVLHHRIVAPVPRQIALDAQPLPRRIPRIQIIHSLASGRRDAFRQNVHRIAFHHAGHHENMVLIERRTRLKRLLYTYDLRLLDGERAGFVEENMRYAT